MKKTFSLILLLSGLIVLLAFSCKKKDPQNNPGNLLRGWKLSSIQNTKTNQIINYPDSTVASETITFTDTLVIINGACGNHGQAHFTRNNDLIRFSDFSIIHVLFCSHYKWEDYVLNNLDSAFRYNVSDKQFEIYSNGTYNLIFIPLTSN